MQIHWLDIGLMCFIMIWSESFKIDLVVMIQKFVDPIFIWGPHGWYHWTGLDLLLQILLKIIEIGPPVPELWIFVKFEHFWILAKMTQLTKMRWFCSSPKICMKATNSGKSTGFQKFMWIHRCLKIHVNPQVSRNKIQVNPQVSMSLLWKCSKERGRQVKN